ncbi:protein dpy-30 homolog isoform X1 [Myotis daubentonii]|uniref:protein dpy-30 homolog isoform X1 n=1 Tax=Myotis daubentonii TaxID=98922 RepID=UPI0028730A82|nr:protein dpy-30 homolog isoform X1 [Myotis daubentonii]
MTAAATGTARAAEPRAPAGPGSSAPSRPARRPRPFLCVRPRATTPSPFLRSVASAPPSLCPLRPPLGAQSRGRAYTPARLFLRRARAHAGVFVAQSSSCACAAFSPRPFLRGTTVPNVQFGSTSSSRADALPTSLRLGAPWLATLFPSSREGPLRFEDLGIMELPDLMRAPGRGLPHPAPLPLGVIPRPGLVSGDCDSQGPPWSQSRCWRDRRRLQKILTPSTVSRITSRPPNPIEFLASYLLKNKAQFEDRN